MRFLLLFVFTFFTLHAQAQAPSFSGTKIITKQVLIASAATTSSAIDIGGYTVVGISFPAAMTGTTTTFTIAPSYTGTYVAAYTASGALSYTTAASRYYSIDPVISHGWRYIKVVSGSAEGADRVLTLYLKSI